MICARIWTIRPSVWGIIQGAVNVNWLSRFWTRTTTRPYLFKLNQTLQYQRMQRYFYPFTDIFCCKKSSTPNLSHHLRLLKYQLIFWRLPLPKKREERRSQKEKLIPPPPGWGESGHRASNWLGQRWEHLKHELGFFYETICRFFHYFMIYLGEFGRVTYSLEPHSSHSKFKINPDTGWSHDLHHCNNQLNQKIDHRSLINNRLI